MSGMVIIPSGGAVPSQVALEYTRGTTPFYPSFTTQAVTTGVQSAATSVNGFAGAITIEADPMSSGCTVSVSSKAGVIMIKVVVPQYVVATGTAYPASPAVGQLFYRTDLAKLSLWNGSAWVGTAMA